MKETFVADVKAFAEAAGHTTEGFNVRQTALYIGLQLEEMAEKLDEILPGYSAVKSLLVGCSKRFKQGDYDDKVRVANRKELLDADVDLAWVTIGSMFSQGADVLGGMKEVARSNLSKTVDGVMLKDENGKVKKPATFSPPNLAPFIAK